VGAAQAVTVGLVNVTAPFAKSLPCKLPSVKVLSAPARMVPRKSELTIVAPSATHQYTLHRSPPPDMTTEKLVGDKAPAPLVPILKIQTPFAGPSSVNWPVNAAAASKQ
jgi:hypothetical protein